jgi:hypothetical protein
MIQPVTPDDARRWLRHSHQRNIDLYKCRLMLNDIESNLWEPTKQTPIIVSKSAGCIADGHHRLITVLMLGRTLDCEVIHVD